MNDITWQPVTVALASLTPWERNKNGERVPGRHLQPQGFEDDARKYNAATADGWLVFRLTRSMMEADPVRHLTPIMDAIKWREEEWSA